MTTTKMKLKIKFRPKPSQIIWAILAIILAIFLLRTALWEKSYYDEKEGSERSPAINLLSDNSLDETPVTETDKAEYTVAADRPRYLSIDALGIKNARILAISTTTSGALSTPTNIHDAGWYTESAKPGQGGTIVIDGHNGAGQKGIFKELDGLAIGSKIEIERGDGNVFIYQVVDNVQIPLEKADDYMPIAFASPEEGVESLTLITCSGTYNYGLKTYNSRQFVRAVRI